MSEHLELEAVLNHAEEKRASDVHLQVGSRPLVRVLGKLVTAEDFPVVTQQMMRGMLESRLTGENFQRLEKEKVLDTAYTLPGKCRFRLNIFVQRGTYALAGRRVSGQIPDFESLNLPPQVSGISRFPNGLVLVTGPTGTGKSNTLAALIDDINSKRQCHILCIEDPIEFLYRNKKALVNQREVGVDIEDFKSALKYAVRQDPDVILVGEIRDADTVDFALRASETGHLVFGTLHSADATQTVGRILNFYPQKEHDQVRKNLALQLRATISQVLLPSAREGIDWVPACELMFVNSHIRAMIANGQDDKIIRAIKAGIKEWGMFDFEHSLYKLAEGGFITREIALEHAPNPSSLEMKFRGIFLDEEGSSLIK